MHSQGNNDRCQCPTEAYLIGLEVERQRERKEDNAGEGVGEAVVADFTVEYGQFFHQGGHLFVGGGFVRV